ncbi:hypothetical protein Taro_010498 [Colocasia esculenta]|uniref:Uncharacterized protein n=1 Tax=Colocasia esculenta TaxID=4460 RepID=A0A843U8E9_COLES|nr:hypothetical protein [Colocasia esculenta]
MAGWNSPVLDPQVVKYQRNRSYTKGEIEAYWRAHRRAEEQHPAFARPQHGDQENIHKAAGEKLQRSSSLPLTDRKGSIANNKMSESILDEFKKTSGWFKISTRNHHVFQTLLATLGACTGPDFGEGGRRTQPHRDAHFFNSGLQATFEKFMALFLATAFFSPPILSVLARTTMSELRPYRHGRVKSASSTAFPNAA